MFSAPVEVEESELVEDAEGDEILDAVLAALLLLQLTLNSQKIQSPLQALLSSTSKSPTPSHSLRLVAAVGGGNLPTGPPTSLLSIPITPTTHHHFHR